jgi:hypothetical protein
MENFKTLALSILILSSLALVGPAMASEITGSLNTSVGNTITGIVTSTGGGTTVVNGGGGGGGNSIVLGNKLGDINHDGAVDILDFSILMANWGL